MALGSLRNLPIHHRPSPAFNASIKSPSMKPRSFFVSPPQEYVAWHQHGNRAGIEGAPISQSTDGVVSCYYAFRINSYLAVGVEVRRVSDWTKLFLC